MPKRGQEAREEYESDDGFVEDAPKNKRVKAEKGGKSARASTGKEFANEDEWEVSSYYILAIVLLDVARSLWGCSD